MTNPQDLLAYLGTDSRRWAAEFCKAARDKRVPYDEDLMVGWFAQAIMAGRIEGQNTVQTDKPCEWPRLSQWPLKGTSK